MTTQKTNDEDYTWEELKRCTVETEWWIEAVEKLLEAKDQKHKEAMKLAEEWMSKAIEILSIKDNL